MRRSVMAAISRVGFPSLDVSLPVRLADRRRLGVPGWRSGRIPVWGRLGDLVMVAGFSGVGKAAAMAAFAAAGYFCVDNLPAEMIRSLVELLQHGGSNVEWAPVAFDLSGIADADGLQSIMDELAARRLRYVEWAPMAFALSGIADADGLQSIMDELAARRLRYVVFLPPDARTLLGRHPERSRRHRVARNGSMANSIPTQRVLPVERPAKPAVTFTSFGHKHAPLSKANLMFDVSFLPNPPELKVLANLLCLRYERGLQPLPRLNDEIVAYIDPDNRLDEFNAHALPMLDYLLARCVRERKAHLNVGIGCSGGRHRSVVVAERLAAHCRGSQYSVDVVHRYLDGPMPAP